MKQLIIFDLDGVITSEETYWDCAGLTLHELLFSQRYWGLEGNVSYVPAADAQQSRALSREILPEWLILSFKARALNSNWDTCYAAVCLHLIELLVHVSRIERLLPLQPWDEQWLASLRRQLWSSGLDSIWDINILNAVWRSIHPFDLPVFTNATGLELFERLDAYASERLVHPVKGVFSRSQPFWTFCREIFQEWLLGDELYTRTHGHAPAQTGKPGCIHFEEPLLPVEQLRATLGKLRADGYTLGIASGRVRQEAAKPLEKYDLLRYFDEGHMGTYDLVTRAEAELRPRGLTAMLGKPHPFQFQAAVDWSHALKSASSAEPMPPGAPFLAVGDSTSDILSGNAAGGLTIAVLTGARSPEARELLLKSQPDFVIEDMTRLPALLVQLDSLATIQQLQFERRATAEKLLRLWFAKHMDLATESVRLTPKAVSLNSFNGFYTSEGTEYFFKTHVEAFGVLDEYYSSQTLDKAGYNVVRPLRLVREKGRQMVIYPVVKWPVVFDLMRALETGQEVPTGITVEVLVEAEREECRHLLQVYADTLQMEQDTSNAPIHQLFWHRLAGKRFQTFYEQKPLPLPAGSMPQSLPFADVRKCRWVINGVEQRLTLDMLIEQAEELLAPGQTTASVVGHGDAHFGNVFLEDMGEIRRYLYFDPAFAGHHSPLLDIVKPLFHNVFAMWMYFPHEIARDLQLEVKIEGERIIVEHNYRLTLIRQAILCVKQEELVGPLVAWLRACGALPNDWQELLQLALMCCPLLTINPFDEAKMPPQVGWLGLSQAVELGNGGLVPWKEEKQL